MENKSNTIIDKEDLRKSILFFLRNWYLFVIFIIISVVAAKFYVHKSTSIYAASISLLLEPQDNYDLRSAVLEGLGVNPSYESITNEMRVVRSTQLVEETLKKLDLEVSYFIKGIVKITEVYKGMPFHVDAEIYNSGY